MFSKKKIALVFIGLMSIFLNTSFAAEVRAQRNAKLVKLNRQKGVEKYYESLQRKNNASELEIFLGCYDAETILFDFRIGCFAGFGVGLVAGVGIAAAGVCSGPAIAVPLTVGPLAGMALGGSIGLAVGFYRSKVVEKKKIASSQPYSDYLKKIDQERYQVMKNYFESFEAKMKEVAMLEEDAFLPYCLDQQDEADMVCSITGALPAVPVRSPSGHLYDKDYIEEYLDKKWEKIKKIEAQDLLTEQDKLKLADLKKCPQGTPIFNKDQLVYDWSFAASTAKKLFRHIRKLEKEIDPFVFEGLLKLAKQYEATSTEAANFIVSRLVADASSLGASAGEIEELLNRWTKDHGMQFVKVGK